MHFRPRPSSTLWLCGVVLFTQAAPGQSLSILRNGQSNFWIQAAAPTDTPYVLQESVNLHLWVDLNDQVSGQSSNQIDSAGIAQGFFRLTPSTLPPPPITLVLLGDSTVADFISDDNRFNGWGQGIYGYFKATVRAVNFGYPLYSTRVFLASAEYTKMLTIKPDYVLVQFGLIDAVGAPNDQVDYVTTLQEYATNLTTIVQTIRGFNGTPILVTPPAARVFDANGKVLPYLPDRCAVVKAVAAQLQTPLIDLNQLTTDFYNNLGGSASAFITVTDNLHYTQVGAQVIAGLVVNALPDNLGPYLTGIFNPPPKP